jgi:hypothetical protein
MRIAILESDPQALSATGVRGLAMASFFRGQGHVVELLSLDSAAARRIEQRRFGLVARVARAIARRRPAHLWECVADEFERRIRRGRFDVVLGRGPEASYVLTRPLDSLKAFDLANVAFLEDYYVWGPHLSEVEETFWREEEILRAASLVVTPHPYLTEVLLDVFSRVQGLKEKILLAPLGCDLPKRRAKWSPRPRIVYAGSYHYIQDPYLLSRISARTSLPIDCYGSRDPNRSFFPARLNYRGFAKDLDFLADYQLGLISLSRDWLRCRSPATKFPAYFSYGLPVLFPEWMKEGYDYPDCAVPFDEDRFGQRVREATEPRAWAQMSEAARQRAEGMTWGKCLAGLAEAFTRLSSPRQPEPGHARTA